MVLWVESFLFFVLCLGGYFYTRSRRTFAETFHKPASGTLFGAPGGPARRGLIRNLLLELPCHVNALSWLMLLLMLRQGGAGSLFWYAVFSLLWMRPQGALAALWDYYRDPEDSHVDLGKLFSRMLERKGAAPKRRTVRLLRGLQLALLCCFLHPLGAMAAGAGAVSGLLPPVFYLLPAVVWVLCRLCGDRGRIGLSALFFLFLAAALLCNLPNLIPAAKLVLRDAFQLNRFLFALSGAGLMQAVYSGARLSTGAFLLQGFSGGLCGGLPHPAHQAVYVGLRARLDLVLHCLLGLLYLCARIVPQENGWIQLALPGFLCVFGMEFFARCVQTLFRTRSKPVIAAVSAASALLLLLDHGPGLACYTLVLFGALTLASLCAALLLLWDSDWYFALLEDYRDVYLWRVEPHPHISTHFTKK